MSLKDSCQLVNALCRPFKAASVKSSIFYLDNHFVADVLYWNEIIEQTNELCGSILMVLLYLQEFCAIYSFDDFTKKDHILFSCLRILGKQLMSYISQLQST